MVKVFEGTENEYYMDGYLKSNWDIAKEVIHKDWDMIFCYDGYEGSGKSVKAMQDAYYCDPTLTNERITFTPFQFKKGVMAADKYQSVVYDEAYTGLSSRATMSMINRTLVSMLAEIRQKNLFIFVVMPCFFDLDKYVALWRSRALIHIYTMGKMERGYFSFYNVDKKKDLYIFGKKFYQYTKVMPNFRGRFTNHYTVDEKIYKENKKNSLIARENAQEEKEIKRQVFEQTFANLLNIENVTHETKAKILGMSLGNYYYRLRVFKQQNEDLLLNP